MQVIEVLEGQRFSANHVSYFFKRFLLSFWVTRKIVQAECNGAGCRVVPGEHKSVDFFSYVHVAKWLAVDLRLQKDVNERGFLLAFTVGIFELLVLELFHEFMASFDDNFVSETMDDI